jgi:hypothetical protein
MGAGQFFGALLIVGGVLIALLCGLCTVVVIAASLSMPSTSGQNYGGGSMTGVALLLGGVPTLFGCLMIWGGIVLVRAGRKPSPPPVNPETFE